MSHQLVKVAVFITVLNRVVFSVGVSPHREQVSKLMLAGVSGGFSCFELTYRLSCIIISETILKRMLN